MAINSQTLENLLKKTFPGAEVTLKDMVGDSDHYGVIIVSALFEGMSRIRRHQEVYKALGAIMGNELHALSLKTLTPLEKDLYNESK